MNTVWVILNEAGIIEGVFNTNENARQSIALSWENSSITEGADKDSVIVEDKDSGIIGYYIVPYELNNTAVDLV